MTNSEKSAKRLREFLEVDKKYKQRLVSLVGFFENATLEEEQRAIQEHSNEFIRFIIESNNFITERLNVDRDFQSKFEKSLKEDGDIEEYFKVPFMLERVIQHVGSNLPLHPELDNVIFIMKGWLHPSCHMAIRRRAIRTLMCWMKDEKAAVPEIIHLFASLIPLKLFVTDTPSNPHSIVLLDQPEYPNTLENPFYPSSTSTSASTADSIALLIELLLFISFDQEATLSASRTLFGYFRDYYLYALYPKVFSQFEQWSDSSDAVGMRRISPEYGFLSACPLPLHTVILRFMAYWLTHNMDCIITYCGGEVVKSRTSLFGGTFNMQEILTTSIEHVSLIQEILRQSLNLSYSQKTLIKTSLVVLRTFTFGPNEKRPLFLRHPIPTDEGNIVGYLTEVKGIAKDDIFAHFLSSFIDLLKEIYDSNRPSTAGMDQLEIFREGLMFIRGLSLQTYFDLPPAIWAKILDLFTLLLSALSTTQVRVGSLSASLEFGNESQSQKTEQQPNRLVLDQESAGLFAQQLAETIFGVWIRSRSTDKGQWKCLVNYYSMAACIWRPLVDEWSRTVNLLTTLFIQTYFSSLMNKSSTRRCQIRSGIYEGEAVNSCLVNYSELIANIVFDRDANNSSGVPSRSTTPLPPTATASTLGVDQFSNWMDLPWTRENILLLWSNIIRFMSPLHLFDNPDIHEMIVSTIVKTIDHFLHVSDSLPFDCELVPPINEFINLLLSICDLPSRPFERSKSLSYAILCKIFTRSDMSQQQQLFITRDQVNRFYLAVLNGLAGGDKDDMPSFIIILLTSRILATPLPGITILFSSILKCLASMLNNDISHEKACILVPMMRLLQNMNSLSHLQDISVPRLEVPPPLLSSSMPLSYAGNLSFDSIKGQIKDYLLMIDLQPQNKLDPSIHSTLLSLTCILLMEELFTRTSESSEVLIDSYLNILLDHLIAKDTTVLLPSTLDHFYTIIYTYQFGGLGTQREYLIIQRLLMAIRQTITGDVECNDDIIIRMVNLLIEWIMTLPHDWLNQQHSLREQLFCTLEECIRKTFTEDGNRRICVEYAIVHLMHYLNNYPSLFHDGDEQYAESASGFESSVNVVYISLYNQSIIALPQCDQQQVTLTMRNAVGKFVWHSKHENVQLKLENILCDSVNLNPRYVISNVESTNKVLVKEEETVVRKLPVFQGEGINSVDLEQTDMLKNAIKYLHHEHSDDCTDDDITPLTDEDTCADELNAFANEFNKHVQGEGEIVSKYLHSNDKSQYNPPPLPHSSHITQQSPFHEGRQLLNTLGIVQSIINNHSGSVDGKIQILHDENGALSRDLKALDRKIPRELIKIALLFRGPGQEDELTMLHNSNDQVSEAYCTFRSNLAHCVTLDHHKGYKGGLEGDNVFDGVALYWNTSLLECIFHDSTTLLLPKDTEEDPQMISKKRYINNDHVQIIWNEHAAANLIPVHKGDFGNVVIIITPLHSLQSFEVRIWRDTWVPSFGPLFDGVIVRADLLAPLIRTTAINAHRAVLGALGRSVGGGLLPMAQRAKDIAVVVGRHARYEWSKEQFLQFIMFGGSTNCVNSVNVKERELTKEVASLAL